MKKINIHNYEAFYLDYLEGNLNEENVALLFSFLDENPDLKNELEDDVLDFKLVESDEVFENKENLKEFTTNEKIHLNNIDSWLISQVEDELTEKENKKLNDFVVKHNLENNKRLIHSTILKANLNEKIIDKSFLKKKEGIIIPLYIKIASIAAVGLLIFTLSQFNSSTDSKYEIRNNNNFAQETTNDFIDNDTLMKEISIDSSNQKIIIPNKINQQNKLNNNLFAYEKNKKFKDDENDSIKTIISPINKEINNDFDFVKTEEKDTTFIDNVLIDDDIVSVPKKLYTEPYKPITSVASNLTKVDMSYKTSTPENEYQVMQIQIGNFGFERKKRK